jgi:hypothetical protein
MKIVSIQGQIILENLAVIPAKAGIFILRNAEIPAFAGMTMVFDKK